jgi:hypothetical protein
MFSVEYVLHFAISKYCIIFVNSIFESSHSNIMNRGEGHKLILKYWEDDVRFCACGMLENICEVRAVALEESSTLVLVGDTPRMPTLTEVSEEEEELNNMRKQAETSKKRKFKPLDLKNAHSKHSTVNN